jgi:DNA-binding CsgD family transcriptional regulator
MARSPAPYCRLGSGEDHSPSNMPLSSDPLLGTLERIGCGGIIRDRLGRVTDLNYAALRALEREMGAIDLASRHLVSRAVQRLLKRVPARVPADGSSWVTLRRESGRPLAMYQLRVGHPPESTILILVDIDTSLQPRPRTLERMFGLTGAEMNLATAIATGSAPADLARQRHVSQATVRSQLAKVFAKTHTRRQAELVALLARVALLP